MSLPILHRRPSDPMIDPERAGTTGAATADDAARERRRQLHARREQRIDEELAASFPASDPPSWVQGDAPVRQ